MSRSCHSVWPVALGSLAPGDHLPHCCLLPVEALQGSSRPWNGSLPEQQLSCWTLGHCPTGSTARSGAGGQEDGRQSSFFS